MKKLLVFGGVMMLLAIGANAQSAEKFNPTEKKIEVVKPTETINKISTQEVKKVKSIKMPIQPVRQEKTEKVAIKETNQK